MDNTENGKVVDESQLMKDFFNEAIAGGAKVVSDCSQGTEAARAASWVYDDYQTVRQP